MEVSCVIGCASKGEFGGHLAIKMGVPSIGNETGFDPANDCLSMSGVVQSTQCKRFGMENGCRRSGAWAFCSDVEVIKWWGKGGLFCVMRLNETVAQRGVRFN
jgi:hypothetical protein